MTVPDKPEKTGADAVHAVIKAAISAAPVVGGPAAELFAQIVVPPLERRRDEWFDQVANAVQELQERVDGLTPESLSKNDTFVSTLLRATQVASRTHQQVKLEALRNAVVNAAMPDAPDETMQSIYLAYVDDLTPWHLRILAFFRDPPGWLTAHEVRRPNITMGAPSHVLEAAMPELRGHREFYDLILKDLQTRGLIRDFSIHTMMTENGIFASRTSEFGDRFLDFISPRK